jgi:hypothetical protein
MVSLLAGRGLLVEALDGIWQASSPCARLSHRRRGVVGSLGWWSSVGSWALGAGGGARVRQPIDQHLPAGGEPLVAVVDPDVLAEGDQGGKAVGGQRAEELVQLGPGGGSRTRCSLTEVGGPATATPMV